ncbi:MAG: methyltransferase type 11, partial [Rhizobiaceae bacterium]
PPLQVQEALRRPRPLKQFQQKCAAVLRPELRENKDIGYFRGS